jgi:hypothetical protein
MTATDPKRPANFLSDSSQDHRDGLFEVVRDCTMNPRVLWLSTLPCWLLCAGCVISTDYPSDWPKQVVTDSHDRCPDISGTFREPGKWASEGNDFSLAQYILGQEQMPESFSISLDGSDRIVFTSPTSAGDSENQTVYSQSAGEFSCDDGRLWISKSTILEPNAGIGVVISRFKEKFGFSKTEDGSLLAEYYGKGGGVMLLLMVVPIPSAGTGNDYVLWQPTASEE